MGGCASKPKDSDDKRPAPIPRDDSRSSLKETKAAAAAALENKEEGEKQERDENKQNEPPLVDLSSDPKQVENDNASSEPKTNVSTDSDAVIPQPKTQDKVENADVATAVVAEEPESKQSVDGPTKLEDKDTPLVTL